MQRKNISPRYNWQHSVEELGFGFHSTDMPYWDESACYIFTLEEVEQIEKATSALWDMCLEAVQHVIDKKRYDEFKIPFNYRNLIEATWNDDDPSIYGRFDLAFKSGEVKLLEFNADTPTSLYEAAIIQWHWLQDYDRTKDQFNSLHEKLVAYWKYLSRYLHPGKLHFTCLKETLEDLTNTEYLRDCAMQAGIETKLVYIDDIGWDNSRNIFLDDEDEPISNIFKLYPWEWLAHEQFGANIVLDKNKSLWIEPAWKMLLSNKAILPILWELFPGNPYLLPAYFEQKDLRSFAKKPILSREGANIELVRHYGTIEQTPGDYGAEGFVFQELFTLPDHEGHYPVIGSWLIGQEPAGIGIRESDNLITGNTSRFVPHFISS